MNPHRYKGTLCKQTLLFVFYSYSNILKFISVFAYTRPILGFVVGPEYYITSSHILYHIILLLLNRCIESNYEANAIINDLSRRKFF